MTNFEIKEVSGDADVIDLMPKVLRTVEEAEDIVGNLQTDELLSIVNLYENDESDDLDSYTAALILLDDRGVDFDSF